THATASPSPTIGWRGGFDDARDPLDDRPLDVVVERCLGERILPRQLERMIAAGYDVERRLRRQRIKDGRELGGQSERVAAALDDEHRPANRREMLVAALVRPARRAQGIA